MKIRLFFSLLASSLFGCSNANPQSGLIDISQLRENEGFIDIPLAIVSTSDAGDYYEYEAKARIAADTVGLTIRLKKEIQAGFVNGEPKNLFLEEGIQFISMGEQSDQLFQFMASQYGLSEISIRLKTSQTFTCANLNQAPTHYQKGESRFKIFLEDENDNAELFVNFDFASGIISLNEKDPEYREPLINMMKQ